MEPGKRALPRGRYCLLTSSAAVTERWLARHLPKAMSVDHPHVLPAIRSLLPARTGLRILDAGCGHGFHAAELAAMGHHVTGIDIWPEKLAIARAAHPPGNGGPRFEQASVYDPLEKIMPPGGWDVIACVELIEHLHLTRTFLRNMRRHLAPQGCLIISTPYHGYLKNLAICLAGGWDDHHWTTEEGGHVKFFSVATLTQVLREAGFGRVEFRMAGRLPYLWKSIICRAGRG
jgi:2-polyprenyl-3-methyl-5-hydroxy-6-metoxy-1,4-benzoquinol methylase